MQHEYTNERSYVGVFVVGNIILKVYYDLSVLTTNKQILSRNRFVIDETLFIQVLDRKMKNVMRIQNVSSTTNYPTTIIENHTPPA